MSDANTTPLVDQLTAVAGELHAQWDKGMKSGKLLIALCGELPHYDRRVTAIREALAKPAQAATSEHVLGPYEHSPQIGAPGSCVMAQVSLLGAAIATFEPTTDPDVATHRARLCARVLNRALSEARS